jgi:transcriptional regulator with XRE-family HTH domain
MGRPDGRYARPMTHCPDQLRRDREDVELRLARVARLLGLTASQLRQLEDGKRWPTFAEYDALAKLYGWPQMLDGVHRDRAMDLIELVNVQVAPGERREYVRRDRRAR